VATSAPDVALIGAMKCATTTLHYQLEKHPDVCLSHPKEMDFFSRDEQWSNGVEWYGRQFPGWKDGQLRLDSSPNYTKRQTWPDSAERLHQTRPDVRLLYLVREPIARIRSHWVHSVASGREHLELDDIASDLDHHIIQTSRYHWQLEPYLSRFDIEQFLVLRFDDVVGKPIETLRRVFDHIGVHHVDIAGTDDIRNSSSDKTRPTELARRLKWRPARGALRRIHPRLADRSLENPEMSAVVEAKVRGFLGPDLAALQGTGLVDVSDWRDKG